jgi:AmmeMemoRadiSam system protein A
MPEHGERALLLVSIAREAIAEEIGLRSRWDWKEDWLRERGASFVTLKLAGELRGCIGSVDARRPLGDDVAYNAHAAAYRDARFPPLHPRDRAGLQVEISVLSQRVPLEVASEDEALCSLRPGTDGIFLQYQDFQATFLPQVWENLPNPLDFLCELRRKARLPARFWHAELRLSRYTVEKYK